LEWYFLVLPKGFAICWIVNLSSDHYHPPPYVALAYHNSLSEKGIILAETFTNFLLTVVNSDSFQLLACKKPEDFEDDDEITQMSTRYWAFCLLHVARLDIMVSF
jgi:hypothetical protein